MQNMCLIYELYINTEGYVPGNLRAFLEDWVEHDLHSICHYTFLEHA